jgi:hypothetical protein
MRPLHDRPEDRVIRRVLTFVILAGTAVGTLYALARGYPLFSLSTAGLAGLGMMLATGIYAAVLAVLPSTRADDGGTPPPV